MYLLRNSFLIDWTTFQHLQQEAVWTQILPPVLSQIHSVNDVILSVYFKLPPELLSCKSIHHSKNCLCQNISFVCVCLPFPTNSLCIILCLSNDSYHSCSISISFVRISLRHILAGLFLFLELEYLWVEVGYFYVTGWCDVLSDSSTSTFHVLDFYCKPILVWYISVVEEQ